MGGIVKAVASIAAGVGLAIGGPAFGAVLGNLVLSSFNPISIAVNIALRVATSALTKKARPAGVGAVSQTFAAAASGRTQLIRQPITDQRTIFGQTLVSGAMVFAASYNNKSDLSIAPVIAGHQVAEMGTTYFDDQEVPFSSPVASGKYQGLAWLTRHLGTEDQAADTGLAAIPGAGWDAAHRGRGQSYFHLKLKWNRDKFPAGIPVPKILVKGKLVWDPRDAAVTVVSSSAAAGGEVEISTAAAHGLAGDGSGRCYIRDHAAATPAIDGDYQVLSTPSATTFRIRLGLDAAGNNIPLTAPGAGGGVTAKVFADNAALCLLEYLLDRRLGLGADLQDIDEAAAIAAANICDEWVAVAANAVAFTVSSLAGATMVQDATAPIAIGLGDQAVLSTTGTLPPPLAPATTYFYVPVTATKFKLAASRADALAGVVVAITGSGAGAHTVTRQAEPRYRCNGVIDSGDDPKKIIDDLLSAMAGVMPPTGGKLTMHAGATAASATTLTDDDLRAGITVTPQTQRRERFNTATGIYVDPFKFWQPTDIPPVTAQVYIDEDGGEKIRRDFELPLTTSISAAERLLKVELIRSRQQMVVIFPGNLNCLRVRPWDIVTYTNARFGFAAQTFRVMGWKLDLATGGVDLVLRIEDPAMWAWAAADEVASPPAPVINLPGADTIDPPAGLALTSGTAVLAVAGDGTVLSRIKAAWTAPADAYLRDYEIAWKKSTAAKWQSNIFAAPQDDYFIPAVEDGVAYDVAIRAINSLGVRSDSADDPATWQAVAAGYTVIGKSALPADVGGLSATQNGNVVVFGWPQVADVDLAGYEIRYLAAPFVWADATPLTEVTRGTQITSAGAPPGAWVFGVKARDTSGNYSGLAVTKALNVVNQNGVVLQEQAAAAWPGVLTNMVRHWTGKIVPESQGLANAYDDDRVFDNFCANPFSTGVYEQPEVDLGFDAAGVRVWADIASTLGPGETTGVAAPGLEIDFKNNAAAYDGFSPWTVGTAGFRQLKSKIIINTAAGLPVVSGFNTVCDVAGRTESGTGVVVAVGGTAIVFNRRFHSAPAVQVTATGGAALIAVPSAITETGFTATIYNTGGVDSGGPCNWQATGV